MFTCKSFFNRYKCKSKTSYIKEELVAEEATGADPVAEGKDVYDNPLFSDDVKVDMSAAPDVSEDLGVSFEYKQGDQEGKSKANENKGKKKEKVKETKRNKYERF